MRRPLALGGERRLCVISDGNVFLALVRSSALERCWYSCRVDCFCSISFSLMQWSYELFIIVIVTVCIRSGGAWIALGVCFEQTRLFYFCVQLALHAEEVKRGLLLPNISCLLWLKSLFHWCIQSLQEKPLNCSVDDSPVIMADEKPFSPFFFNVLSHNFLSIAMLKALTQLPVGTSCLFCLHFLFFLGSLQRFSTW